MLRVTLTVISLSAFASFAQPELQDVSSKLANKTITVSSALTDPRLMPLHSLTSFRELIKSHAVQGRVSIATTTEPGTRILVKGTIVNISGQPVQNTLVYVYQTSSTGWYSDTAPHILKMEGDRKHARLFGYFRTGNDGSFEIETIQPKGYPGSDLPAHIHFEVSGDRPFITELLFDDDERLTGNIRERAIRDRYLISRRTGKDIPTYIYRVVTN